MRQTHVAGVDLNLLPLLEALLAERHVSRAASRVNLSQPAMSRALKRLRLTLGDDLLVRGADGYRLTPRAQRIGEELAAIMPRLEALVSEEAFEPAQAELAFHLIGSDYAVGLLGPKLFAAVVRESPNSTLRFHGWHDGAFEEAARGTVDLVLFGSKAPAGFRSAHLLTERFVCVVAGDHPLAGHAAFTLEDYRNCAHLIVDVADGRQPAVDDPLDALGASRKARLTLPYHAGALMALPGTRLVATLPERFVDQYVDHGRHRVLGAPAEIPAMDYRMAWHPYVEADPAHAWLRSVALDVAATDSRATAAQ